MLAPEPDMKILDFCAGSGGKTTHIAALALDSADIMATDQNTRRLGLLRENIQRLGIESIKIAPFNDFIHQKTKWKETFDRILIDAPCSGLGVIRRRPDIKWNRNNDDIPRLAALQLELLEQVMDMCKVKGKIIYSVCTTEPEETRGVVGGFLKRNPQWHKENAAVLLPDEASGCVTDGFLVTQPSPNGPDGFFAAILERMG
jgi:16S rRNA (cytosine967-C5)-methyltransferase